MANWLEEILTKLDTKVDKLDTRLDTIDITLAKHEANLNEHMRRTNIAEENIDLLRADTKQSFKEQSEEIKPLTKHVQRVEGFFKLLGIIASIVGVCTGLLSLFKMF